MDVMKKVNYCFTKLYHHLNNFFFGPLRGQKTKVPYQQNRR